MTNLMTSLKGGALTMALTSIVSPALASTPVPVNLPEPGTIGMVAMVAVGAIVAARCIRRK